MDTLAQGIRAHPERSTGVDLRRRASVVACGESPATLNLPFGPKVRAAL